MKVFSSIINLLRLISAVPAVLLLVFSSYYLFISYRNFHNANILNKNISLINLLINLNKEINQERTLSIMRKKTDEILDNKAILHQRISTDQYISKFLKEYVNRSGNSAKKLRKLLINISKIRNEIDTNSISFDDMFFKYFRAINTNIQSETNMIENQKNFSEISNLLNFLIFNFHHIDSLEAQKDFIGNKIILNTPFSKDEINKWINSINNDQIETQYMPYPELRKQIIYLINQEGYKSLQEDIDNIETTVLSEASTGNYSIEYSTWFFVKKKELELRYKIMNIFQQDIELMLKKSTDDSTKWFILAIIAWVISAMIALTSYLLRKRARKYLLELNALLEQIINLSQPKLCEKQDPNMVYKMVTNAIKMLQDKNSDATQASRSKFIFLNNISHEIRTPLNGIIGFSELLKNTELSNEQKEYVKFVHKSSEELLKIIEDILEISKIQSGKISIENIIFSPIKEFEAIIESCTKKAYDKKIEFLFFLEPNLIKYLEGDLNKVRKILLNLIENAIKFSKPKSKIEISIKKVQNNLNHVTSLEFTIKDSDIVISSEVLKIVFDHSITNDKIKFYRGSGLGLSITNEYIKILNSKIEVKSAINEGNQFNFVLNFNEVDSQDEDYHLKFSNHKVAMLGEKSGLNDEYLEKYLNYLGIDIDFLDKYDFIDKNNYIALFLRSKDMQKIHISKLSSNVIIINNNNDLDISDKIILNEPITITNLIKIFNKILAKKDDNYKLKTIKFNANILVAEDEEKNRIHLNNILREFCDNITIVEDGYKAIQKTDQESYDIIFMDVFMRGLNGVLATKKISNYQNENILPHTPIIAMTTRNLPTDSSKFTKHGFDGHIIKPVSRDDLMRILKIFIHNKIISNYEEIKTIRTISNKYSTNLTNTKDVLLLKKSLIENKIFSTALKGFCQSVDTVCSFDELKQHLIMNPYKLVLIDYNIPNFQSSFVLKCILKAKQDFKVDTKIVLFIDPHCDTIESLDDKFNEVLKTNISKTQLEVILKPYIR